MSTATGLLPSFSSEERGRHRTATRTRDSSDMFVCGGGRRGGEAGSGRQSACFWQCASFRQAKVTRPPPPPARGSESASRRSADQEKKSSLADARGVVCRGSVTDAPGCVVQSVTQRCEGSQRNREERQSKTEQKQQQQQQHHCVGGAGGGGGLVETVETRKTFQSILTRHRLFKALIC